MTERVVVVDWEQVAKRGETLFPGSSVVYANGSLPMEALETDDCILVSTDAERLTEFCRQVVAASCRQVRYSTDDISHFKTRQEVLDWNAAGGLHAFTGAPIPDPAPQESNSATVPPPSGADVPAGAGPDDGPPEWMNEIPDDLETVQRSIRTAAALKKHAFEDSQGHEWGEPADYWGVTELPDFPPDCLPPDIAPYVLDQADLAGVDPAQVALNCYVACAALIRTGIDLQMQEDAGDEGRTWREKPILWGAVVGDPSTGKGPALDIALHKFYKINSLLRAKDEAAWEQYDKDCKIYEKRMQSWFAEQAKTPTGLMEPAAPIKPPRERLWTDDVTKEVVAKLLTENPRGKIAIIKDELASWFGGFDAYGNGKSDKDRPDWLSFYESKERYIDRAMEGRSYHVPSWGGIILGGIQPEVLSKISGKLGADGMLQRFQIVVSKPKRQVSKRQANADATRHWHKILENLASMEPGEGSVRLSPEAARFMDDKVQWISTAMQSGIPPALVAALGKWEGLFGRLMIVSHCIECAAHGMRRPAMTVSLQVAEQVWRWMRNFLWPHAAHFYLGSIDQGEEAKSCRAFADYVLARGIQRIKPHVLASGWSHYSRNFKTMQARREFWARVEQAGWVRPMGIADRSTSLAREYEINPHVFDGRFNEQITQAKIQAARYRETMHPRFLEKQGRQPGED